MAEQTKDEIVNLVMAYFEAFEDRLFEGFGYSGDPDVLTEEQIRRETRSRHAVAAQLTQAAITASITNASQMKRRRGRIGGVEVRSGEAKAN